MVNTTLDGPKSLYPDVTFNAQEIVPEALIYRLTTQTLPIEGDEPAVRVPYVSDAPKATFTNEADPIPESDSEFSEILIHTRKLALLSRNSREAVSYPNAAAMVATSMATAITSAANQALLTNADNPTGLLNFTGITAAGPMATGDLDVLSDAITTIEAAGATANTILMDPASWGALRKLKAATGSAQLLLGSPAEQTERRLFGVPVLVSGQMPAGTILALDSRDVLSSVGEIRMDKSDQFYFDRDSIAYRITWRFGWNVIHPERIAKLTIDGLAA